LLTVLHNVHPEALEQVEHLFVFRANTPKWFRVCEAWRMNTSQSSVQISLNWYAGFQQEPSGFRPHIAAPQSAISSRLFFPVTFAGMMSTIVQERLEHSDIAMTQNRCSHVTADMQQVAADAFDRAPAGVV
jgi:hypothetical protein